MSSIESVLQERMQKKETQKMKALGERSGQGQLSTFGGLFSVSPLETVEVDKIRLILNVYAQEDSRPEEDLTALLSLTAEVKALTHQAALLHGERIQKVHTLLIGYREGAFTAWLVAVYGNRQTPYNLLHYYEFYQSFPKEQRAQLERMPRQAIYTLATREGSFERKQQFVMEYQNETKQVLLTRIRSQFPLADRDGRAEDPVGKLVHGLEESLKMLSMLSKTLSREESLRVTTLLATMQGMLLSQTAPVVVKKP